ncbi:MAG: hypothetical protein LBK41_06545 [Clostridiales bacterium]|jgi:hypothetical protein|nr:hypothetical protein [Clostridiales bacterium]
MYPAMVNSPETMLMGAIDAEQTEIIVSDSSYFETVSPPYPVTLGRGVTAETVLLTAVNDGILTVSRAFQNAARSWPDGTSVARNFTAYDHEAFRANVSENASGIATAKSQLSELQGVVSGALDSVNGLNDSVNTLTNTTVPGVLNDANAYTDQKLAAAIASDVIGFFAYGRVSPSTAWPANAVSGVKGFDFSSSQVYAFNGSAWSAASTPSRQINSELAVTLQYLDGTDTNGNAMAGFTGRSLWDGSVWVHALDSNTQNQPDNSTIGKRASDGALYVIGQAVSVVVEKTDKFPTTALSLHEFWRLTINKINGLISFITRAAGFATSAQGVKADSALQAVAHDTNLSGAGTVADPLAFSATATVSNAQKVNGLYFRNNGGSLEWSTDGATWSGVNMGVKSVQRGRYYEDGAGYVTINEVNLGKTEINSWSNGSSGYVAARGDFQTSDSFSTGSQSGMQPGYGSRVGGSLSGGTTSLTTAQYHAQLASSTQIYCTGPCYWQVTEHC